MIKDFYLYLFFKFSFTVLIVIQTFTVRKILFIRDKESPKSFRNDDNFVRNYELCYQNVRNVSL